MKSRTNFFKCLWISAISGRSSENSRMQSDAYSSSFLRKTTAESCDQEGWMVSGSRMLLLFIAWRPAGGADWPYQLCRLHLYQEGQLLLAFPLQLCWFGSFMIWAEQKHYLNMLAIRINIDFNSREQVLDLKDPSGFKWLMHRGIWFCSSQSRKARSLVVSMLKHLECLRPSDVYHPHQTVRVQPCSDHVVDHIRFR